MQALKRNIKHLGKQMFKAVGLEVRRRPQRGKTLPKTRKAVYQNGHLPTFLRHCQTIGFKPRGLVDIGAHRGAWTVEVWKVFPDIPAILVDPLQEVHDDLLRVAQSVPGSQVLCVAVGAQDGDAELVIVDDLMGSSLLQLGGSMHETRVIPTRTGDSILGDNQHICPDIVKLDIQGFELSALASAESLFGKTELFVLEVSLFAFRHDWPVFREVSDFMYQRGYELYDFTSFLRRPIDGALGQMDVAFVKADGIFRSTNAW